MSADSVSPDPTSPDPTSTIQADTDPTDSGAPATGRRSRRRAGRVGRVGRLSWAAAIVVVVLAAPAAAFGIAGGFSATHGTKAANAPQSKPNFRVGEHVTVGFHAVAGQALPATTGNYDAYVAAAGGN